MMTTILGGVEGVKERSPLLPNLPARKNLALPVFRLPPETFADIFILAAHDYQYHEIKAGRPALCVPDWVNISYVCRHWRDVALNCPTLWSYHFIVSFRWTEELLIRSQQAYLKIYVCYGRRRHTTWWSHLLERLLDHAERIQELHLDVPGTVLPTTLSLPPHLQVLDIRIWSGQSTFTVNCGEIPPRLRNLMLARYSFPWHSLDLSGITTLSLCDIPARSEPSIVEFLATLNRMQTLSTLHIEFALPSARDFLSGGASVSPAILPGLACLAIISPLFTVIALLSYIKIPLETQLQLQIQLEDDGPSSIDDYAQISSALQRRFGQHTDIPSSRPTFRSLVIHFPWLEPSTVTISALERGDCDPHLPTPYAIHSRNISFMMDLRADPSTMTTRDRDRIISDICCSIPSTHIEKLHVIRPPTRSPDFWSKTLGHLDGLRCIKLSGNPMPDLVSLLTIADEESPKGHDRDVIADRVFVPALEELELYCIAFASKFSRNGVSKQSLLDALATRKALHPRLITTECT